MSEQRNIEFDTKEFNCVVENGLAILTIKGNAFMSISSIARNVDIIPWFDNVENEPSVKGILVLNENDSMSDKAYIEFLKDIVGKEFDPDNPKQISHFEKGAVRTLEITILSNLIRKFMSFRKLIIIGINGEIVTPFFGLSLAADFRFASADSSFIASHIKYMLHPSGALPFFLPMYIGKSKVTEILYRGDRILADELKSLGLINDVYPKDEYIKRIKEEAFNICKVSFSVVSSTKILLNRHKNELNNYLNLETDFFTR